MAKNIMICDDEINVIEKLAFFGSKEELLEVILSYKGNFTKIGLHYGVSDNAVRKWCKSYDMPTHSKDYKN